MPSKFRRSVFRAALDCGLFVMVWGLSLWLVGVAEAQMPCPPGTECPNGTYCSHIPGWCVPNGRVDCGSYSCNPGDYCGTEENHCVRGPAQPLVKPSPSFRRQSAQNQTFGSGRLFHVGGDKNEVQKAYLISIKPTAGEDGSGVSGTIKIERYTQTLSNPTATTFYGFNTECYHIDAPRQDHDVELTLPNGARYQSFDIDQDYAFSERLENGRLIFTPSQAVPPRNQWLGYNLWWAVCGHFANGQPGQGRFVPGNDEIQKYVWQPPATLAAEDQAESDRRAHDQQQQTANEQRAREAQRQIELQARWDACKAYNLSACDAALQTPNLWDWQRSQLVSWRSVGQQFNSDVQACKGGSAKACEIAISSPAATPDTRVYLQQWRDAASPWNRTLKYLTGLANSALPIITAIPLSTLIAGAAAVFLAGALGVVLYRQQRKPPSPPREWQIVGERIVPKSTNERAAPRVAAITGDPPTQSARKSEYLEPQPSATPTVQKIDGGGAGGGRKALGVIVNIFFPGIGTMMVGKIGVGIVQLLLTLIACALILSWLFAFFGSLLAFINWIWAIISAASSPQTPRIVVVQTNTQPG